MQWIVEEKDGKTTIIPTKLIEPGQAKAALSPLAWKILKILSERESYPKEIGNKLKVHEQKIYYHIRNLEKSGLIKVTREDTIQGARAKFYSLIEPSMALSLKPLEPSTKLFSMKHDYKRFLEPFVTEGRFNATIIIGNTEPHGPTKEKARDSIYATNVALFFGTFLNYTPKETIIKYDTDVKAADLKSNLILIGGPGVNAIVEKVNKSLPIRFEKVKYKDNWYDSIYSDVSGKRYSEETFGFIVKAKNPFDKTKEILVIAGRRSSGTKAASLALFNKLTEIVKGNSHDQKIMARIIDGIDADSDGIVDSVEILE